MKRTEFNLILAALAAFTATASAQTPYLARLVVREGVLTDGAGGTVTVFNQIDVSPNGSLAMLASAVTGGDATPKILSRPAGGSFSIKAIRGAVDGYTMNTSPGFDFTGSALRVNDSGQVAYSATAASPADSIFVDQTRWASRGGGATDTPLPAGFPGYGNSGILMLDIDSAGRVAFLVRDLTANPNSVDYFFRIDTAKGTPTIPDATTSGNPIKEGAVLGQGTLATGDTPQDITFASLGFPSFTNGSVMALSSDGLHYLINPQVNAGGTAIVIDGAVATFGGMPLATNFKSPPGILKQNGWSVLYRGDVNNRGDFMISTSDVDSGNFLGVLLVKIGGKELVLKTGDQVLDAEGNPYTLPNFSNSSSIPRLALNNQGDWAAYLTTGTTGSYNDMILVNGVVVVRPDVTPFDANGNGLDDESGPMISLGTTQRYAPNSGCLGITDRRANGTFDIYFTGQDTAGGTAGTADGIYLMTITSPPQVTGTGMVGGQFEITLNHVHPDRKYELTRSLDLVTPFQSLEPPITFVPSGSTGTITDPAPPSDRAFYRVQDIGKAP